jgi:tight adherence protein C
MPIVLITVATFLVVTSVVLSLGYTLRGESAVTLRVRRLVGDPARLAPQAAKRAGLVGRMLMAIGNGFGGDRSIAHRLSVAGFRAPHAAALFLGARTLVSLVPALLVLVPAVSSGEPLGRALMIAALYWGGGHVLANGWLKRRTRARVGQITRALPDALDLMVVCLEAGLGLNATIARVGEERSTIADILGDEFAMVALELRNGRSRADALRALSHRNGSDDLKALVGLVIQSDKLGASMAQTLRTHADLLRTKRRQRAEEAARKLPIKILFPLALFILPALFVVVLGPAVINLPQVLGTIAKPER